MSDRAEQLAGPEQLAVSQTAVSARGGARGQSQSRGRLSRSAEFDRVYRHGRSTGNRHLVLYTFPNQAAERPRMGLSVSRRVGGAVERNRVKRLLREAWAHVQDGLVGGQDVVVLARPEARELAEREGLAGIEAALGELIDRAHLREEGPASTSFSSFSPLPSSSPQSHSSPSPSSSSSSSATSPPPEPAAPAENPTGKRSAEAQEPRPQEPR